jgi:hypothetical protein
MWNVRNVKSSLWWIPRTKMPQMSKSKIKIMLICFFDSRGISYFEFVLKGPLLIRYSICRCWKGILIPWGARRVVERLLIDSSPRQHAGTFFTSSVAIFSRKWHLHHGSSAVLSRHGSSWSVAVSKLKSVLKGKRLLDVQDIKSSVRKILSHSCSGF